jgi:hypothetical protein
MKGLLVRVGIDQTYGGWNAPADPTTGRSVDVTRPENRIDMRRKLAPRYAEFLSAPRPTKINRKDIGIRPSAEPAKHVECRTQLLVLETWGRMLGKPR